MDFRWPLREPSWYPSARQVTGCVKEEVFVKSRQAEASSVYYADSEVARLLGITVGRLRNKLSAGSPLPPRIQPPGSRHRLWPRQAVHAWLEQFLITSVEQPRSAEALGRRGRPTKQEVRARYS